MFKKLLALALALMLAFSCLSALAEVKNADIVVDNENKGYGDIPSYVESIATTKAGVYALTYGEGTAIYFWDAVTGEMKSYPIEAAYNLRLVGGADTLYTLSVESGLLSPVVFGEDAATLDKDIQLDWAVVLPNGYDQMEYYLQIYSAFFSGDSLYLLTSRTDTDDWYSHVLYHFNMETGAGEQIYMGKDMGTACAYKDGKLLGYRFDEDRYYLSNGTDTSAAPAIWVFDPAKKAYTEELFKLDTDRNNYGGLAYSTQRDTIYLAGNGGLMFKAAGGELAQLNYLPISYVQSSSIGMLVGDTHYVISEYGGIYVRSLNPEDKPEKILKVAGGNFSWEGREGYLAFTKKYPDIPVVMNNDYLYKAEDITTDMKTDNAADIYALSSSDVVSTLIAKGYCVDLTGDAVVAEAVKAMYPQFTSSFMPEGKVYALPYIAYLPGYLGYSPSVLNEIGLTEADLPTNFSEYLDLIADWADIYSLDYPNLSLMKDQWFTWREHLLNMALMQQIAYCNVKGTPITFNEPELIKLLNKIDSMASLFAEVDPEEQNNGGFISYYSGGEAATSLLTNQYEMLSTNYYSGEDYVPLKLNYFDDVPMYNMLQLQVLVVNPNSKNQEVAMQFLREMAVNPNPILQIMLCPGYNEPIANPYYEQNVAFFNSHLENLHASLEAAEDADKKNYEDSIIEAREQLKLMERETYQVSLEQIEAYRADIDSLVAITDGYSVFASADTLSTTMALYLGGEMTAEAFIQDMEKTLRRIYSERK